MVQPQCARNELVVIPTMWVSQRFPLPGSQSWSGVFMFDEFPVKTITEAIVELLDEASSGPLRPFGRGLLGPLVVRSGSESVSLAHFSHLLTSSILAHQVDSAVRVTFVSTIRAETGSDLHIVSVKLLGSQGRSKRGVTSYRALRSTFACHGGAMYGATRAKLLTRLPSRFIVRQKWRISPPIGRAQGQVRRSIPAGSWCSRSGRIV
jgi:hypothetical protein